MPKTTEVSPALREFNGIFEKLCHRWDYSQVFQDFLIISIFSFYPDSFSRADRDEAMKRYSDAEKKLFNNLFYCWLHTFAREMEIAEKNGVKKSWDFFGEYYEVLSSRGKRESLGQFFTPKGVGDLLNALIECNPTSTVKVPGQYGNDPACGSGRLLIASHVASPGNYLVGEDIDRICCYMTCLNMYMHGCTGEVIWHDSLNPDSFSGGWLINPFINGRQTLGIIPIEYKETILFKIWMNKRAEVDAISNEILQINK